MRVVVEFDMDDEEDVRAHTRWVNSGGLAIEVWDLIHNFSSQIVFAEIKQPLGINPSNPTFEDGVIATVRYLNKRLIENGILIDKLTG